MNTSTHSEQNALQTLRETAPADTSQTSAGHLMMDSSNMDKMLRVAEVMACGRSTIPKHLQGNVGDCMAIVMQSVQWGMNPYAVAQKTHTVNGTLGYEAQLVAAVINNSKLVKDRFNFEWFGEWTKVLGRFIEKDSKKNPGEKYRVPGWSLADEKGLGIKVWATIKGESEPRMLELLLSQAGVRNSTLWADDPKQQLAYLAQKRWARLYAPDVILGVYTPDEFDQPVTKDMGSAQVVPASEQGPSDELVAAARHAASQGKAAFAKFWNATPKDTRPQLRHIRAECDQTAADFDAARTVETPAKTAPSPKTFNEVMTMICEAKTEEALFLSADWINAISDQDQQTMLNDKYDEILSTMRGAS